MLGDMLGVNVASRRTLVQLWQLLQGLPSFNPSSLGLSLFVVAQHPCRPAVRAEVSGLACGGCWTIAASAWLNLSRTRLFRHRTGSGRPAIAQAARRALARNPGVLPVAAVVFCDDHRTKRRNVARICDSTSRTGR